MGFVYLPKDLNLVNNSAMSQSTSLCCVSQIHVHAQFKFKLFNPLALSMRKYATTLDWAFFCGNAYLHISLRAGRAPHGMLPAQGLWSH